MDLSERQSRTKFDALYKTHNKAVLHTAYRLTNGLAEDAEDLAQESWERAWKMFETYNPEKANHGMDGQSHFLIWIRKIVQNTNINRHRDAGAAFRVPAGKLFPLGAYENRFDKEKNASALTDLTVEKELVDARFTVDLDRERLHMIPSERAVLDMFLSEHTQTDVCKQLGLSYHKIQAICTRLKVPIAPLLYNAPETETWQ